MSAGRFAADPKLAVISFRVVDPAGGPGARWYVPRLRAGDPGRSSQVTTFVGCGCAIRRSAYLEAGGLPDQFFYAHEETDLSWRLLDLGYRLAYDAAARVGHPAVPNARHPTWYRLDGRNRVLLARRNLPWPAGLGIPDGLASDNGRQGALGQRAAGLARRFRRRLADGSGPAAPDLRQHSCGG